MKLRYTPEALADLQDIRAYIQNDLRNPIAAGQVVARIMKECGALKQFPQAGPPLQPKVEAPTDLRYWVCGNYIAFYRIDDNVVSVARIMGGQQDYLRLLFGEESL